MLLVIPPGDVPVLSTAAPREAEEAPAPVRLDGGRSVGELPDGAARTADTNERDRARANHHNRDPEHGPPRQSRHGESYGSDPTGGQRQRGAAAVREVERRREHEDGGRG